MNTPNIRFKGYTDPWEQRKFGDEFKLSQGLQVPVEEQFAEQLENTEQFIRIIDVTQESEPPRYVYNPTGKGRVKTDDIFFVRYGAVGTIGYGYNGVIANNLFKAEPLFKACNMFLFQLFSGTDFNKKLKEMSASTSMPAVNFGALNNLTFSIPSYEEQNKIGEYFAQLDNLITLHQRKCDETKELKKYMLQKMFPQKGQSVPEIRFDGYTDPWEQRKLGELASFSKGSGYSKSDLTDIGTPIILYGRLYTKYETVISEVDTFADAKSGSVYSKGGEVIVPGSGETAEDISIASVVENAGVLLGGDLNIITPPEEIDSAFLAISISNGKPHKDMAKMAQGKSVVHLHNSDLEKIDLPYPSVEEQRKISGTFANLDNLITLHQRKHDELAGIKKYMLQNMFPQKGA